MTADDPEAYAKRNARLADVLFEQYGNVAITDVRYLNISVMVPDTAGGDGNQAWKEYEPAYPTEVKVSYTTPMDTTNPGEYEDYNDKSIKVVPDIGNHMVGVHYTENGSELLNTNDEDTGAGISETVMHTDGFSDYDFVYIYEYEIIDTDKSYSRSSIKALETAKLAKDAAGGLRAA